MSYDYSHTAGPLAAEYYHPPFVGCTDPDEYDGDDEEETEDEEFDND